MQRLRRRTKRFCYAIIVASLIAGPLVVSGQASTVSLSQVLERAMACGPAFREYTRSIQQIDLARVREENENMPAWRVALGARVNPAWSTGSLVTMDWQLTENASVDLTVPAGTPSVVDGAATAGKSLSLRWSKMVWPSDGRELQRQIDAHEEHISQLELRAMRTSAVRDVITSFYTLQAARAALDIAERSQALAQGRADHALERYQQGLIGLRDLQAEQDSLHQASVALQRAMIDLQRAHERLNGVMGDCEPHSIAEGLADDIDWDGLVDAVTGLLDVSIPLSTQDRGAAAVHLSGGVWEERLLINSVSYQRAVASALAAELAVVTAEGRQRPTVSTVATAASNLESSDLAWSVGIGVVWDMAPNRQIEYETAKLNLQGAQEHLEQARKSALDAGRTAWLAVSDSMYAVELAESALSEAQRTQNLVERRIEAGLAPAVERDEAKLEVDRRGLEVGQARANLWLAWFDVAAFLGMEDLL